MKLKDFQVCDVYDRCRIYYACNECELENMALSCLPLIAERSYNNKTLISDYAEKEIFQREVGKPDNRRVVGDMTLGEVSKICSEIHLGDCCKCVLSMTPMACRTMAKLGKEKEYADMTVREYITKDTLDMEVEE